MNTLNRLVLAGLVFTISGCNSGGGETANEPGAQPPPVPFSPGPAYVSCASMPAAGEPSPAGPAASPGGIWSGTLTNDTQRTTFYLEALVSEDGHFHFRTSSEIFDLVKPQFAGIFDTVGNVLAGTGRAYQAPGDASFENAYSGDMEIIGVVDERKRLNGTWTVASGDSGCFSATHYFKSSYELPSSVGAYARTWTSMQNEDQPTLVLTNDADGRLNGQSGDGCILNGYLAPVDERYSLYVLGMSASGCPTAADYAGLAYFCRTCGMGGVDNEPSHLLLYFDNGVRAMYRWLD